MEKRGPAPLWEGETFGTQKEGIFWSFKGEPSSLLEKLLLPAGASGESCSPFSQAGPAASTFPALDSVPQDCSPSRALVFLLGHLCTGPQALCALHRSGLSFAATFGGLLLIRAQRTQGLPGQAEE